MTLRLVIRTTKDKSWHTLTLLDHNPYISKSFKLLFFKNCRIIKRYMNKSYYSRYRWRVVYGRKVHDFGHLICIFCNIYQFLDGLTLTSAWYSPCFVHMNSLHREVLIFIVRFSVMCFGNILFFLIFFFWGFEVKFNSFYANIYLSFPSIQSRFSSFIYMIA